MREKSGARRMIVAKELQFEYRSTEKIHYQALLAYMSYEAFEDN